MIVALTGFMASGKTTFGRAAAARLGWDFLDLDQEIGRRYGSAAELFDSKGEAFFRAVETEVLSGILSSAPGDTVLALGGGAIIRKENLQMLREASAPIVWLDTDFEIILSELDNSDRPTVRGKSVAEVRAIYEKRRPLYAAAADVVFPVRTTDYAKVIEDLAETIRTIPSP